MTEREQQRLVNHRLAVLRHADHTGLQAQEAELATSRRALGFIRAL